MICYMILRGYINSSPVVKSFEEKLNLKDEKVPKSKLPPGVKDFDFDNRDDPYAVACYAKDIFKYYKEREVSLL